MSRYLPHDVKLTLLYYLPLTYIQRLNPNAQLLIQLFKFKYQQELSTNERLTTLESYTLNTMLKGEVGYLGQLFFNPYHCLALAVKANNFDCVQYYLHRTLLQIKECAILLILAYNYATDKNIVNLLLATYLSYGNTDYSLTQLKNMQKEQIVTEIQVEMFTHLTEPGYDFEILSLTKIESAHIYQRKFPEVSHLRLNMINKHVIYLAKQIYDYVVQAWNQSINRDRYLALLAILLNRDFNQSLLFASDVNFDLSSLAYKLMVSVLHKDLPKTRVLSYATPAIPSEILYLSDIEVYRDIVNELSLWLTGRQVLRYKHISNFDLITVRSVDSYEVWDRIHKITSVVKVIPSTYYNYLLFIKNKVHLTLNKNQQALIDINKNMYNKTIKYFNMLK